MNRNKFILGLLAALPIAAYTRIQQTITRAGKGFKTAKGEGRYHGHITLKGVNQNVLDVKISGKDTDGDLAMFEQTSLSQGRGTAMHIHHNQDEMFYVIDGSYQFQVGDDHYTITTGDSIFLPRKVQHSWVQVSERGKMIVTFQPAGKMEDFFVAVAALTHEPSPEEMAKLFAENEMTIAGPPIKVI